MAGSINRSFRLLGASWSLLGRDPKLLLLPLGSLIVTALVTWGFWAAGIVDFLAPHSTLPHLIGLYVLYALIAFVDISANSVVVAVAMERLDGREATIGDGWTIVRAHLGAVLRWALVSATVGIVLRLIQERTGLVGVIATWIGNLAWGLATVFVVPVLLFEPVDVRAAIRRSARVFRDRWGEEVTGQLAIGAGLSIFLIPAVFVGAAVGVTISPVAGGAVVVLAFLAVITVSATLNEIFTAALYRYAVSGAVPPGMSAEDFGSWLKPRHRLFRRSSAPRPPAPPRPDVA
jgi:hypothetical protein